MSHVFSLVLVGLLALSFQIGARADSPSFNGHYELADLHADHSFSLDVKQSGDKATLSFSAGMTDGSGAAPDGEGNGNLEKGELVFKFKDSFENEGSGTLTRTAKGYRLTLDVSTVVEPRPLRFYGDLLLRKTAGKSQLP